MAITLTKEDFNAIGQVAKHCNLPKLEIAINESILFDLKPLLCDLFYDVDENWSSEDEEWTNIIEPLVFEGCNEKNKSHEGLKNVLIRYAYARYVILNGMDDTPNGAVTKTNDWSIPKPYSDIKQISDRYRSMGYELWHRLKCTYALTKMFTQMQISIVKAVGVTVSVEVKQKQKVTELKEVISLKNYECLC